MSALGFFAVAGFLSAAGLLSAAADGLADAAAAIAADGALSSAANISEPSASVRAVLSTTADFRNLFIGTSPFLPTNWKPEFMLVTLTASFVVFTSGFPL